MASLPRTFVDNPIARAELNHQERTAEQRRWRRWPALFMFALGIGLLSNVVVLLAPLLARPIGMPVDNLREILFGWSGTVTILIGALIMIHHLSFSTAAIQIASSSIAREKRGLTWESLLLTGVDARQIVFGKWWATMRTLWRAYRSLLWLRFAVALWMGLSVGTSRISPFASQPALLDVLLIGLVTAIFPLCYAAFAVTMGLLASLLTGQEAAAYRLATLLQFSAIFLSLCMILFTLALPLADMEPGVVSLVPALFVTPLDGGMLALLGLVANSESGTLYYLLGLVVCIAFYAGLTWGLLRGAQALAVHQRALPPRK